MYLGTARQFQLTSCSKDT